MGYACPVCDVPQRDGKHLANHMAFTALLRHEDHEAWLDDHVDSWSDMNAETLAEHVVEHAEDHDFEEVFEDTTDGHDHSHGHGQDHGHGHGNPAITQGRDLDTEAQQILQEAQELTKQMMRDENEGAEADDADGGDATDDEGADHEHEE